MIELPSSGSTPETLTVGVSLQLSGVSVIVGNEYDLDSPGEHCSVVSLHVGATTSVIQAYASPILYKVNARMNSVKCEGERPESVHCLRWWKTRAVLCLALF